MGNTAFLKKEFLIRTEKNPNYSLRAFAKALEINVGTLSALMSGRRPLTAKTAKKLCDQLDYSPVQRENILKRIPHGHQTANVKLLTLKEERLELEEQCFRIISDWYHYAILQIIRTDHYREKSTKSKCKMDGQANRHFAIASQPWPLKGLWI